MHPQTLLMTKIRNVPTKVATRKHSKFVLTSQKAKIVRSAREPRSQGLLVEGELANQYLGQKILGDLITADHNVLNEGA